MGLNRTQTAYDRGKFFLDGHDLTKPGTHSSHGSEYNRSDGWRALAGCFYLTSVYVPFIQCLTRRSFHLRSLISLTGCLPAAEVWTHNSTHPTYWIAVTSLKRLESIRATLYCCSLCVFRKSGIAWVVPFHSTNLSCIENRMFQ